MDVTLARKCCPWAESIGVYRTWDRGIVPDYSSNTYFLSWGLFYLSHHNRILCLAYTKHSHFLSWLLGITELALLWIFGGITGFLKVVLWKGGTCLWVFNCSPLPYHWFLIQKVEREAAGAFWSVNPLEMPLRVVCSVFIRCEVTTPFSANAVL